MATAATIAPALHVLFGLLRDDGLTGLQKFIQVLIVWLLPLLGMLIVLSFQGLYNSRAELRERLPYPFYMAGFISPSDSPFRQDLFESNRSDDDFGEGACGSD